MSNTKTLNLLWIIILLSCAVSRAKTSFLTTYEWHRHLLDSLRQNHVDTIVSYIEGSTACPAMVTPFAAIYWRDGSKPYLAVAFEQHASSKTRDLIQIVKLQPASVPYRFEVFQLLRNQIAADTIDPIITPYVFSRTYNDIYVRCGADTLNHSILSSEMPGSSDRPTQRLIDHFRSYLLTFIVSFIQ